MTALAGIAAFIWLAVLALPWRPWSTRERLETGAASTSACSARDVVAIVPARDEAQVIGTSLRALLGQAPDLDVVVVDDQSSDGTAGIARTIDPQRCRVIAGRTLPPDWTGKLWALQQGVAASTHPWILFVDADIVLAPGVLPALLAEARSGDRALVSLMAELRMQSFWERLLIPPFIYFFKLLHPFALANRPGTRIAAAAGGVILIERQALEAIGGLASLREAIIDDCTLAARIKAAGFATWLGLTRSARSLRAAEGLGPLWRMVSRTAYTQLRYDVRLLALCVLLMLLCFAVPLFALASDLPAARAAGAVAFGAMCLSYLPTLAFYRRSPLWTPTLPLAALLFLLMTLDSALAHRRGVRSRWKGRAYAARGSRAPETTPGGR